METHRMFWFFTGKDNKKLTEIETISVKNEYLNGLIQPVCEMTLKDGTKICAELYSVQKIIVKEYGYDDKIILTFESYTPNFDELKQELRLV